MIDIEDVRKKLASEFDWFSEEWINGLADLSFEFIEQLQSELKQLREGQEWVKCSDRLPEKIKGEHNECSRHVLVVEETYYGSAVKINSYNHKQGFWSTILGTEKITYWKDVPVPPQDKEG